MFCVCLVEVQRNGNVVWEFMVSSFSDPGPPVPENIFQPI